MDINSAHFSNQKNASIKQAVKMRIIGSMKKSSLIIRKQIKTVLKTDRVIMIFPKKGEAIQLHDNENMIPFLEKIPLW